MYVLQSSKRSSLNRLCLTLQLTSASSNVRLVRLLRGLYIQADIELALLGYVRDIEAFLML